MRFCSECGALLEVRELEHRPRVCCPQCGRVYYAQLKVGAGAWIEREGRLLLLRRAREPFKHCWNLPAGYVEADESPVQGVLREVREETGLQVVVEGWWMSISLMMTPGATVFCSFTGAGPSLVS